MTFYEQKHYFSYKKEWSWLIRIYIYIYLPLFCFSLFDNVTEFRNKPKKKETEMPNDTRNNELCQEHSSLYGNRK